MSTIRRICVYCGSGPGDRPAYVETARTLGRIMAESGIGLVYGGGSIGLMGEIARSVLEHGGEVMGIIPEFLTRREGMLEGGELVVTRNLHERKQLMFEKADAFVALPGGVGTLEELVEQMTWAQLGRHRKPILIANIDGFWDRLCDLLAHMERSGFIRPGFEVRYAVADKVEDIVPALRRALAGVPEADKDMKTAEVEKL